MNIIVTTQTQFKPQTLLPDLTSFGFDTNIGLPTHITLYKIGRPICGQSFLLPADRTLGTDNFESECELNFISRRLTGCDVGQGKFWSIKSVVHREVPEINGELNYWCSKLYF